MRGIAAWNAQQDEWRKAGLCTACGEPAADGHKLCEEHLRYHRHLAKEKRAARKAAGQCLECGEPSGGKTLCERHREAQRERMAARRANREYARQSHRAYVENRRRAGLCARRRCKLAAGSGGLCAAHADPDFARKYQAEKMRRLHARWRAAGLCVQCRWKNDRPGHGTCSECHTNAMERMGARFAERRAQGLCRCGRRPRAGAARCGRCRAQQRRSMARLRQRRRREGLCTWCKNPRMPGKNWCAVHVAKVAEGEARRKRRRAGVVWKDAG